MNFYDTIAALSTPQGKGGVAVIRISGAEAIAVAEKVFFLKNGAQLSSSAPRVALYGDVIDRGETVDDGLAVVFRAPRSFTGEDTVEISCHGGIYVTQRVLSAVLAAGARAAEAGEFTRRAFVNGKLGLGQAEALGTLLEARNDEQIRLSRSALGGRLDKECREIYGELRSVLAQIYASVDYPDEELADMTPAEMQTALLRVGARIEKLSATYSTGHAVIEGIRTVICGKPNVGKSSLYNRLVGREAAIVTEHEGTTRDLLTETVTLGRVTLRLCDTAGIRSSSEAVEQIGIERAREEMRQAELILAVFDGSRPLDSRDREILDDISLEKGAKIVIINKNDEDPTIDESVIEDKFDTVIRMSAQKDADLAPLCHAVEQLYINEAIDTRNDAVVMNARQHAALTGAARHVALANEALLRGESADVAGVDVEIAMSALAELDGREIGEDIVSEIFSRFCVGK